jgi:hypothetical protein
MDISLQVRTQFKERLQQHLRRLWCVLGKGGHTMVRHHTTNRISLRCFTCGHSTPGWEVIPKLRTTSGGC